MMFGVGPMELLILLFVGGGLAVGLGLGVFVILTIVRGNQRDE